MCAKFSACTYVHVRNFFHVRTYSYISFLRILYVLLYFFLIFLSYVRTHVYVRTRTRARMQQTCQKKTSATKKTFDKTLALCYHLDMASRKPRSRNGENARGVIGYVDEKMYRRIEVYAIEENATMSEVVRRALTAFFVSTDEKSDKLASTR